MEYCPICNIEYPTGTKYCQKCKNQLLFRPSPSSNINRDCPDCGKKIPVNSAICPYCHAILQQNTNIITSSTGMGKKKKKKKFTGQLTGEDLRKKIEEIPIVTITCPKCSSSVLSDFENCPHCGTLLNPSQMESKSHPFKTTPTKSSELPTVKNKEVNKTEDEAKPIIKPVRFSHDITPEPGDEKYLKEALEEQKVMETQGKLKNGKKKDESKKIKVVALDTQKTTDSLESQEELEDKWKTINCPHCNKPTRTHTGRCLHCGQPISSTGIDETLIEEELPTKEDQDIRPEVEINLSAQSKSNIEIETEASTLESGIEPISSYQDRTEPKTDYVEPELEKIIPTIQPKRFSPYMLFAIVLLIIIGIGFFIKQQLQSPRIETEEIPLVTEPPVIMNDSDTITLLLDNVRDAMLSQDTILYLSVFSPTMEDLEERRKGLQELWDTYQIQNLQYQITEEKPIEIQDNKAEVIIEWDMNLRRFKDNELITARQRNHVKLLKINGQWKIAEVSIR